MAKPSSGWSFFQKKWVLMLLVAFSASSIVCVLVRPAFDSCERRREGPPDSVRVPARSGGSASPLGFMRSKLVLLVSHELSLSGKDWWICVVLLAKFGLECEDLC